MIRVVVDPGVFISALMGSATGAPNLVVRAFADERLAIVVSPKLLTELELVARRPKFRRWFDERSAVEFVERIRRLATVVEDPIDPPSATRDPKDDYLVALALASGVDAIVSGDRDLLDADFELPPVWSPRETVTRLTSDL